ncbi:MAG: hypothetical protein FK733_12220, partial [Asgard group archaeon]|nr:hypothetical protein [Asgard group archaeon]
MAKKITRISIVIALGFLLTFVSSLTAANNNDIYDDMTAENYIGSTTVTWGDSLLDWGAAVGIDSDENVVIVGYSETEVGYNLTVVKYDSYFNYLWNTTWEIDKLDKPQDLVIDGSDNIIITGSIWQGPTKNVFILKYDADGILLWNETWVTNTFDEPYGIDVNSGDEIYITGTTTSTTGTVFILKYDADGILLWNSTYGDYDQAVAYDIKVNNTDIYLTGYIEYPYMKQLFLGKFDSVGTNVWAETLGGPGTEDIGKGLIVTGEDVYVVGQTESLANYLTDTIILKYNSTGHIQWYRLRDEEEGNSIALRPDGNILIAGDIGYSDGLFA